MSFYIYVGKYKKMYIFEYFIQICLHGNILW